MFRRNVRMEDSHEDTGGSSAAQSFAVMHSARASWIRGGNEGSFSAGNGVDNGGADASADSSSKWTSPSWTTCFGGAAPSAPEGPSQDLLVNASGLLPMPNPVAPSSGEVRMILLRRTMWWEEERLHQLQIQAEEAQAAMLAQTQAEADQTEAPAAVETPSERAKPEPGLVENAAQDALAEPAPPEHLVQERQDSRLVLPVLESLITLRRERMNAFNPAVQPQPASEGSLRATAAPNTTSRTPASKQPIRRTFSNANIRSATAAASATSPVPGPPAAAAPAGAVPPPRAAPSPSYPGAPISSAPQLRLPPQPSLSQFPGPWRSNKWETMGDMLDTASAPIPALSPTPPAPAPSTASRESPARLLPNGARVPVVDSRPPHVSQSFTFGSRPAPVPVPGPAAAPAPAPPLMPQPPQAPAGAAPAGAAGSPRLQRFTSQRQRRDGPKPPAYESPDGETGGGANEDEPAPHRSSLPQHLFQRFKSWRKQRQDRPAPKAHADDEEEEELQVERSRPSVTAGSFVRPADAAERPAIGPTAMPLWMHKAPGGGSGVSASGEWKASASGEWKASASGEWKASASGEWKARNSGTLNGDDAAAGGGVASRSNSFVGAIPSFRTRPQSFSTGQLLLPTETAAGSGVAGSDPYAVLAAAVLSGPSVPLPLPSDGRSSPQPPPAGGGVEGAVPVVFGVRTGPSRLSGSVNSYGGEMPRGNGRLSLEVTPSKPQASAALARQMAQSRGRFSLDAQTRSAASQSGQLSPQPQLPVRPTGQPPQEAPQLLVTNSKRRGDGSWQSLPPGLLPLVKTSS